MTVLVCDDDIAMLRIIQKKLESENLAVFLAKDGAEAMQKLKDFNFDAIITDIHMPHYSGDDIVRFVRQDMKSDIPIVMLSADGEEEVVALALREGVDAFIKKPVRPDDLVKAIRRVMKKVN